jgi:ParB-like chromosome segregation protein Spo0J
MSIVERDLSAELDELDLFVVEEPSEPAAEDVVAVEEPSPEYVAVWELLPADTPRLCGEDEDHARALAATDADLPPILVHRPTMRVIDGMHRLQAAILKGSRTVKARYFDGSDDDAFVLAVRSNIRHGKPLTLSERETAARRILGSHPDWSDRSIATVCGISSKTVASIRRAAGVPPANARIGLDGRIRPLDCSEGRMQAAEFIEQHPDASLREVAQASGISPGTVRDVRARLRRGIGPVPRRANGEGRLRPPSSTPRDVRMVTGDAAVCSSEVGAAFVSWLEARVIEKREWEEFVELLPLSRVYLVSDVARSCATAWMEFAEALEERASGKPRPA